MENKTYSIAETVEHLKNGGAIENDNKQLIGILRYVLTKAETTISTGTPTGTSNFYYIASRGCWCDEVQTYKPIIKLSQISESMEASTELESSGSKNKIMPAELWDISGGNVEKYRELMFEHGHFVKRKTASKTTQQSNDSVKAEQGDKWIEIKSADDLPKEKINCWVKDKEADEIICGVFLNNSKQEKIFWLANASHYLPIIKPQPPKSNT